MAATGSPMDKAEESPNWAGVRPWASTFSTATPLGRVSRSCWISRAFAPCATAWAAISWLSRL